MPYDWIQHLIAGAIILCAWALLCGRGARYGAWLGVGSALAIGILREAQQEADPAYVGGFDWMDVLWTIGGAILAAMVVECRYYHPSR